MMAAKVGTGIVAELGSMRISDEIDALEVMGFDSIALPLRHAPARHVDGAAVRLHRRGRGRLRRLLHRGRAADRRGLGRRLPADLLAVPEPGRPRLLGDQGHDDGDVRRARRRATTATTPRGGPVGVGTATAKSMVVNILGIHLIGMLGTQLFWGGNPRAPIGG